jgi:hypothetical protein
LSSPFEARGNPGTTAGPLRKIVAEIDPRTDVRGIRLLEDAGREQTSFLTGMTSAMTALGMMALLMSVVSIYALLSFMVTRRTREIGIRVALGARRSQGAGHRGRQHVRVDGTRRRRSARPSACISRASSPSSWSACRRLA